MPVAGEAKLNAIVGQTQATPPAKAGLAIPRPGLRAALSFRFDNRSDPCCNILNIRHAVYTRHKAARFI